MLARGRAHAEDFIRHGVETWQAEGRIDDSQVEKLMSTLNTSEAQAGMLHAGAHFAISLPLRFPFGAAARFLYTLGLRLRGEFGALLHRGSARAARRMHTWLVMLVALLPGFGRLAYFFSPALRDERLLLFIPLDQVARKLPFRAYSRLHLDALFVYWGLGDDGSPREGVSISLRREIGKRLAGLRPYARPLAFVLAADAVMLLTGAYLYVESGGQRSPPIWWFREGGPMAWLNAGQLMIGAAFGIAAYRAYWHRRRGSRTDAAGIFLWATGGIGLAVFAVDDFFTIHERAGDWLIHQVRYVPILANLNGDMLILGYAVAGLVVLLTFRAEVFSGRPSATLLQLGAVAAVIMVAVDGFATALALKALEFPAQTLACSLLMLAFVIRRLEIGRVEAPRPPVELCEVAK